MPLGRKTSLVVSHHSQNTEIPWNHKLSSGMADSFLNQPWIGKTWVQCILLSQVLSLKTGEPLMYQPQSTFGLKCTWPKPAVLIWRLSFVFEAFVLCHVGLHMPRSATPREFQSFLAVSRLWSTLPRLWHELEFLLPNQHVTKAAP